VIRTPPNPIAIPPADALAGRYATLSTRERRVFRLLAEGHSQAAIAHLEYRAAKTIDNQAANVRLKMGCHDRVILSRYAIALGLLDLEPNRDRERVVGRGDAEIAQDRQGGN